MQAIPGSSFPGWIREKEYVTGFDSESPLLHRRVHREQGKRSQGGGRRRVFAQKHAKKTASRLLTSAAVREEIAARRAVLEERTQVTQERVLREYARIGFLNPRIFLPKDPALGLTLEELEELSEDDLAAVSELTLYTCEGKTTVKIKCHSKNQALEAMARHLGLFEKDNKRTLDVGDFIGRLISGVPESRSLPGSREEY